MGCASGNKVPGLPWKDQGTILNTPLNQIGNTFCPFLTGKSFVPCKVGYPALPCVPRRSFLRPCVSEKSRLSRSTTSSLFWSFPRNKRLCPVDAVDETYVQSSRRPNQTHCLFLMSNHIIQSLRLLLADGYAWPQRELLLTLTFLRPTQFVEPQQRQQ